MMDGRSIGAAILVGLLTCAARAPGAESPRSISVEPNADSPTAGIQEAIESLGPQGGLVKLGPGEYLLRQSIRVRSNLTMEGAGEATVLRKSQQAGSKLAVRTGDQDRSL